MEDQRLGRLLSLKIFGSASACRELEEGDLIWPRERGFCVELCKLHLQPELANQPLLFC